MAEVFVNKVAESGIITLDPKSFLFEGEIKIFDLKDHLFMGLILKEKDFRAAVKAFDWSVYKDAKVAVFCSADAIIPVWAYMLVVTYLQPVAGEIYMGQPADFVKRLTQQNIDAIDISVYSDQRVVLKGCGDTPIPDFMYFEITHKLLPVVKSIMYGEPCSTVPVYKKAIVKNIPVAE